MRRICGCVSKNKEVREGNGGRGLSKALETEGVSRCKASTKCGGEGSLCNTQRGRQHA